MNPSLIKLLIIVRDIDEAPEGTRASMNGQVPATVRAKEFLKRQTNAKQDQLIGKTRANALRAGGSKTKQLVDQSNRPISADRMLSEELKNIGED